MMEGREEEGEGGVGVYCERCRLRLHVCECVTNISAIRAAMCLVYL